MTDPEQFTTLLNALGCSSEAINEQIVSITKEVDGLKAQLADDPTNDSLKEVISQKEIVLSLSIQTQEQSTGSHDFGKYLKLVQTGKIDVAKSREIAKNLKEGNINALITNLPGLAPDITDTPEVAADKDKKRKEMASKIAGMGALGIGMVFVLLWNLAVIETKEVKKAIK